MYTVCLLKNNPKFTSSVIKDKSTDNIDCFLFKPLKTTYKFLALVAEDMAFGYMGIFYKSKNIFIVSQKHWNRTQTLMKKDSLKDAQVYQYVTIPKKLSKYTTGDELFNHLEKYLILSLKKIINKEINNEDQKTMCISALNNLSKTSANTYFTEEAHKYFEQDTKQYDFPEYEEKDNEVKFNAKFKNDENFIFGDRLLAEGSVELYDVCHKKTAAYFSMKYGSSRVKLADVTNQVFVAVHYLINEDEKVGKFLEKNGGLLPKKFILVILSKKKTEFSTLENFFKTYSQKFTICFCIEYMKNFPQFEFKFVILNKKTPE